MEFYIFTLPTESSTKNSHQPNHPSCRQTHYPARHRQNGYRVREFEPMPDGSPSGERHGRGAPLRARFCTTGNLIGMERDCNRPRDASFSEIMSRASCQIPTFVATSVFPTRVGNQDIFSSSHPSIARRSRNAKPFDASINGFLAENEHSTSYFSGISVWKQSPLKLPTSIRAKG